MATATAVKGNHIGGREVSAPSGMSTFTSVNPANHADVVGVFPRSSEEEIAEAVKAATKAFQTWSTTPAPVRGDVLLRIAERLTEEKESLAQLMSREMGKVLVEARGDVQEAIDMAKYMAGEGRRALGATYPSELRNKWAMTVRAPLGVVGCITPWNFPIAIPSWKSFAAIMAGNAVVLKPAEDTPMLAARFVEILESAGLPPGVLNVVHGLGEEAGEALLHHPDVKAISFTGSVEVGRHVAKVCGEQLKRFSLELGGKNAIVVLDDADLDLVVDGAIWGAFGTSGQRCTATSRLIVQRKVLAPLLERLVARARKLRIGPATDPATEVGAVINDTQKDRILSYIAIGKEEGATLLTGGNALTEGAFHAGSFIEPTIFSDVRKDMRIAQEEIFGPVLSVIPVDDFDEAIEVANSTPYGLSLSIYTASVHATFQAIERFDAGLVYVNAPTIGAEIQLPFGGTKQTGNGFREAGATAFDEFTEWKSVYIDYSGQLQRAQIDTEA